MSPIPLSRLFVSLLPSKQAVTPIPTLAVKGTHIRMHKHARTCRHSCEPYSLGGEFTEEMGSRKAAAPIDPIALFMGVGGHVSTRRLLKVPLCVCVSALLSLSSLPSYGHAR